MGELHVGLQVEEGLLGVPAAAGGTGAAVAVAASPGGGRGITGTEPSQADANQDYLGSWFLGS